MKRKILFLIFVILLIVIGSLVFVFKTKKNKVCLKNNCYFVEIARTQEEKERGLMDRNNLGKNEGMLFINEQEGTYPFWMKNVLIPLDIIWLDKDYKIAYIFRNARPCEEECENIVPGQPAQYVLELNAGEADKIGLEEGSEFRIDK